jgi:hypothetical protein
MKRLDQSDASRFHDKVRRANESVFEKAAREEQERIAAEERIAARMRQQIDGRKSDD